MKIGEAPSIYVKGMSTDAFEDGVRDILAHLPEGGEIFTNPPVSFPVAVDGKVVFLIMLEGDRIGYDVHSSWFNRESDSLDRLPFFYILRPRILLDARPVRTRMRILTASALR